MKNKENKESHDYGDALPLVIIVIVGFIIIKLMFIL